MATYNSDLQNNNIKLQQILDTINALPDASESNVQREISLQNKTINPSTVIQTVKADSGYDGLGTVTVNEVKLQTKAIGPTEGQGNVYPDAEYNGLDHVIVHGISTTYIGSAIARKSSSDLSASGAIVTVPAGYYESQSTKSVNTTTQATPSITVSSTGLITATVTQSAGYVSSGSKSDTRQMETKGTTTITPTSSSQTAIPAGTYATGNITISAVPTQTKTVVQNGTVTPDAGKFLSSVTVNVPSNTYYTGSSDPSSSLGVNGDLYFKMG